MMLATIRSKFGPWMIGGIVAFIAFVFVFSDIARPGRLNGLHDGAVAGIVNGDAISISDFNRALNQRLEFFKNLGGAGLTDEQLKAFRIKESVFSELVSRKIMTQQAESSGLIASDEEVRQKIKEIPAFQKDGKFDPVAYRNILQANNYSPSGFESMVREDLSLQSWSRYFRERARVSSEELKQEFLMIHDKRNIKYVVLTYETGRKAVKVSDREVKTYLQQETNMNLVKTQYENRKKTDLNGKTFEQAKEGIAREILAGQKVDEVRKFNDDLINKVAPLLSAKDADDRRVNDLLKPYGAQVKKTGMLARNARYIPGVGQNDELIKNAFEAKSPIDPSKGGKAKVYQNGNTWMAAIVAEAQKPDLARLNDSEREKIQRSLISRKEQALQSEWLKRMNEQSDIDRNEAVVGSTES